MYTNVKQKRRRVFIDNRNYITRTDAPNRLLEPLVDSSWREAGLKKLLESELTSKMYQKSAKYIPLEPLDESPEIAQ